MSADRADAYEIQGRPVALPVEVRDASSATVLYAVPAARVAELLPGDTFEIAADPSGSTQLAVGLIDYRDNDLGDYLEVSIVFFVRPRGAPDAEAKAYIHRLPVNQAFTCEAGRAIWGYPKTVESIEMRVERDSVSGTLHMDGQRVLSLRVPRGRAPEGAPEPAPIDISTYSYVEGVPHLTPASRVGNDVPTPGGEGVSLELGRHPVAEELRGLGLPAAPMLSVWTERWRGTFGAPRKL